MLNAVESDETEVLRVLVSVESAVLSAVSMTVRDEADVLSALDKAETASVRNDISLESEVEIDRCEFVMLVAKLVSPPIAVANSAKVSNAVIKLEPAMDSKLTFTNDSVATRSPLILGLVVKVHASLTETLPVNNALPITFTVLNEALVKFARLMLAF